MGVIAIIFCRRIIIIIIIIITTPPTSTTVTTYQDVPVYGSRLKVIVINRTWTHSSIILSMSVCCAFLSIETEEIGEMHCRVAKQLMDDVEKKLRDFRSE